MAAEETANELSGWVIALISTLSGVVIAFFLNLLRDKLQRKNKRIQAALENHFNSEMIKGLHHIGQRNGLVIFDRRNNELCFSLKDEEPIPMTKNFPLNNEEWEAFKVHFSKIAEKWDKLFKHAQKLREDQKKNILKDEELSEVSSALKEISEKARELLKHIQKNHRIGTKDFKYNKKCPICKKF